MARRVEKKTKAVIWTKDLHNKFLEAIGKLGIDYAVPKKILELMEVDGLTRDHVASHLQKYRILSKKIANANCYFQTAVQPSLLESSMTNWSNSSYQEQMNWPSYSAMHAISPPILDTSRSYFPVVQPSDVNSTITSELTQLGSLPNKGYSMQAVTNNLDEERNFFDDTINTGVVNLVNSSNSDFVQNLDGCFYDYVGGSTRVQNYNSFEMGSSGGVPNPNGFESDYFNQSEFVETSSLYGAGSNSNLEGIGEDDLILNEVDIAHLLSYLDDNNLPINLDPPNQDVNWQNIPNNVSIYLNHNEQRAFVNQHDQTLDGYLPGFDPTFKVDQMDEQLMDPLWSPEPVAYDMTLHGLNVNSYVQA